MAYPQTQQRNKTWLGQNGHALLMLIFINAMVFIILKFTSITYELSGSTEVVFQSQVLPSFYLPAKLSTLATHPWVIVAHMFSHYDVWMLVGNMFFLWTFGFLLQDLTGNRHIVPVYIYGALTGAVLFVISANLLPKYNLPPGGFSYTGAGASVMTMALAATVTSPDYRLFPMIGGGIPIWVITAIFVVIDIANLSTSGNAFPKLLAHAGGAAAGFIYMRCIQAGADPGQWMHQLYNWFFNLFDPSKRKLKPVVKKQVFYNTKGRDPFVKKPNLNEKRVDDILDKISAKGYDSLTQEEKDILKRASENEN
ncbi:MAG: rhomboid family intramembrane serine protease [Chitinophagaceae bacterium]|nr:rhomboid family intramembrane serine protease [Chitinophagaceae bacterium]